MNHARREAKLFEIKVMGKSGETLRGLDFHWLTRQLEQAWKREDFLLQTLKALPGGSTIKNILEEYQTLLENE